MARQIINYDEEMVGADHPTKSDTLNRALLVSHADTGGCRHGTSFPSSGLEDRMMFYRTDEDKLYVYDQPGSAWRGVGGPVALDNGTASLSFTANQSATVVDLSTYVPANARRAKLLVSYDYSVDTERVWAFAKANGAANWQDAGQGGRLLGAGPYGLGLLVPVDGNRKIQFTFLTSSSNAVTNGKVIVAGYEL
jgi:hypothetical protein